MLLRENAAGKFEQWIFVAVRRVTKDCSLRRAQLQIMQRLGVSDVACYTTFVFSDQGL